MEDGAIRCTPPQLRALCVSLLSMANSSEPARLWMAFRDRMSLDFLLDARRVRLTTYQLNPSSSSPLYPLQPHVQLSYICLLFTLECMLHVQVRNNPSLAMGQDHYDSSLHDIDTRLQAAGMSLATVPGMPQPSSPVLPALASHKPSTSEQNLHIPQRPPLAFTQA